MELFSKSELASEMRETVSIFRHLRSRQLTMMHDRSLLSWDLGVWTPGDRLQQSGRADETSSTRTHALEELPSAPKDARFYSRGREIALISTEYRSRRRRWAFQKSSIG